MTRRRPEQAQARLLEPRPVFDRRQRLAMAAVHAAGYWSGRRGWDAGADLLLVRMGLQLNNRLQRWGYQVSNPRHFDLLQRVPEIDDAEPGPAWLRRVYTLREDRMPLTLPSARALLEEKARMHDLQFSGAPAAPAAQGPGHETPPALELAQQELFA